MHNLCDLIKGLKCKSMIIILNTHQLLEVFYAFRLDELFHTSNAYNHPFAFQPFDQIAKINAFIHSKSFSKDHRHVFT